MSAASFLCELDAGRGFPDARPGQFVHVRTPAGVTLRRPFSVAGVTGRGRFELLIRERGCGTRSLAALEAGAPISVVGPLGNAFTLPEPQRIAVLVGGGIGVAGLRLLAGRIAGDGGRALLLVGATTGSELLHHVLPGETEDGRIRLRVSTDDGSQGLRGTVCSLLERELDGLPVSGVRIYCCGPRAMLSSGARVAIAHEFPCEVLMEEVMACGVGACRGCVVRTRHGYRAACSDGPVFDASEVVFEEESVA